MNQPTQQMWQMLSELLEGEQLPETLNNAIYALCEGKAKIDFDGSDDVVAYLQMRLEHAENGYRNAMEMLAKSVGKLK